MQGQPKCHESTGLPTAVFSRYENQRAIRIRTEFKFGSRECRIVVHGESANVHALTLKRLEVAFDGCVVPPILIENSVQTFEDVGATLKSLRRSFSIN